MSDCSAVNAVASAATGAIGVTPESTRRVRTAEKSAILSATDPASRGLAGNGAAAAGSIGATWSTVVMSALSDAGLLWKCAG